MGFDLEVVAPATHDTGSAVLAVPANDDDFIYISSGTWSLMGIERKEADCSEKSCEKMCIRDRYESDLEILAPDKEENIEEQNKLLKKAIEQKPDAILFSPSSMDASRCV